MEKEHFFIKTVIFNMREISLMKNLMDMENIFLKMEIIMKVNLKMVQDMEKEQCIIKMVILYIKEIGLLVNMKDMEN